MTSFAQHVVEWGDGNTSYMGTSDISHSYSTAGTYTIRIWTREKSLNFYKFDLITSQNLPSLDLSFAKTMYRYYFQNGSSITYLKLPQEILTTNPLYLYVGFINFTNDSDILDFSSYFGLQSIFRLFGSSNVKRIVLPLVNNYASFQLTWYDDVVEAIGPNAGTPGNYEVDLDLMNISTTCRISAPVPAHPNNFNSINLPATAFSSAGITTFFISGSNCTTMDVSNVRWNQTSNIMQMYIINNRSLQNLTLASSPVSASGMFRDIVLYDCRFTNSTLDFSAYQLSQGSSLYVNSNYGENSNTHTVIFKASANTTLSQLYAKRGIFSNFNFTDIPNATDINDSYLEMSGNGMTAAQVNKILYDLDTISVSGYTGRQIFLSGNSAPDSSSGGYDGLTAKTNLITKGFTVYTA